MTYLSLIQLTSFVLKQSQVVKFVVFNIKNAVKNLAHQLYDGLIFLKELRMLLTCLLVNLNSG
jgi:hypothetical protein